MPTHVNDLTRLIIGSAIEVHRHLGAGLLESAYHICLARELEIQLIPFKFKWPMPVEYKGLKLAKGYELDLLVADSVIVEVKSVITLAPVHEAQLLTYMRLAEVKVGLLMNFNEVVLKNGIRRKVLNLEE
ncbi:MAG TPA: GxxExxY protein [Pyrinomonadaceae bacterium]